VLFPACVVSVIILRHRLKKIPSPFMKASFIASWYEESNKKEPAVSDNLKWF